VLRESELESRVKDWCKAHNILFIKFTPKGEKGWPDRIAITPKGVHIWVELKRKGKKPTELQRHRMETLRKQNAYVFWCDNYQDTITAIATLMEESEP